MTRTATAPTLTGEIAKLIRRVTNLERRATATELRRNLEVIFAPISATDVYGPDWLPKGGTLYRAEARCLTASASSSTILIQRNLSTITGGTLTFAANATRSQYNLTPATFRDYDNLTLDVTAGLGLGDLAVHLFFTVP